MTMTFDLDIPYDFRAGAPAWGEAGWASARPGKNQGGHGPPWKF